MTQLEIFEERLRQLQDEMGIYLHLGVYKDASDGKYSSTSLYANEERSVHLHKLITLDLKNEPEIWYKYYNKDEIK